MDKLFLVVLIVIIIILLFILFTRIKIQGDDYYQRELRNRFINIEGHRHNENIDRILELEQRLPDIRPIDHYRLGTTHLLNANNRQLAARHFNQALQQIINMDENTPDTNTIYILDRIEDMQDLLIELDVDLPLQEAILADYDRRQKINQRLPIDKDDPEYKQKTILAKQEWHSDSQNVHDSAMSNELKIQYDKICEENKKIPNGYIYNYNTAIDWLKKRFSDTEDKNKLNQLIEIFSYDYTIELLECGEQELISCIWKRIHDEGNKGNYQALKDAFADAIMDCIEGGFPVCKTGRSAKLWQLFAKLDKDPAIGILKNKQSVRNEIYERCAKILNEELDRSGLAEDYNKGMHNEEISAMINRTKESMDHIKKEYSDVLSEESLDRILSECKDIL